jgi:hypothetical protein
MFDKLTLLLFAFYLISCSHSDTGLLVQTHEIPKELVINFKEFGSKQAVVVANHEAIRRGIDLTRFFEPEARESLDRWFVFYKGKSNALGDHFSISVDFKNGNTFYSPGR